MKTAVDTNVLIDVFLEDATYGERSLAALRRCSERGELIACEVVWAEVAAAFSDRRRASAAMRELGVRFTAIDEQASLVAGRAWHAYRCNGGTRRRLVADFLIGAHAATHADQLLTRDRGFRRLRFSRLELLDPSA
jgi:predicted nucleic acid-binding protein